MTQRLIRSISIISTLLIIAPLHNLNITAIEPEPVRIIRSNKEERAS